MTSLEMPQRVYMPCAFAGKDGATVANILAAESSTNVNFPLGFPPAYGCPESGGGKFVSRGEMNALGHISTQNEFARACGGIVTFDPQLADQIGGYPAGAVLDFLDGINYCKVISLRDNNTVDFRSVGADGVNWSKVDMVGSVKDPLNLIEIPDVDNRGTDGESTLTAGNGSQLSQCVGIFKSSWDGALYISGGADVEFGMIEIHDPVTGNTKKVSWGGVYLTAFEGNSVGELSSLNAFSDEEGHRRNVIFGRGFMIRSGLDPSEASPMKITKGKYYAVFLAGVNFHLYNSTLSVRVSADDNTSAV